MRKETSAPKGASSAWKKLLIGFGILLIVIGVALSSFALSFQVMIEVANPDKTGDSLEAENARLKQQVQILNEQVTVLQNQVESGGGKITSGSGTSSTASSTGTSSGSTGSSSSSTSTSSGSSTKTSGSSYNN